MYFYSKKSHKKIVHLSHCSYFQYMSHESIGKFENIEDAQTAGYRICKCCAPISKYYRKEYYKIKDYAAKNGIAFYLNDGALIIQTPRSKWKIITNGNRNYIFLYHKNIYNKGKDKSLVPGYHSQSVRRSTIMGYLKYIVDHDNYRMKNPEYHGPVYVEPARKGTKRYKKEKTKERKRERYQSVMRVLALIENEKNYRQLSAAVR